MGKLIVTEFITADGVIEAPGGGEQPPFKHAGWQRPYSNEAGGKFKYDELLATDALLLGRRTYDAFAAAWPQMGGDGGFGDRMNSLPKYVASTTLKNPAWNNSHVLGADLAGEVSKLKASLHGNVLVYGSGKLANALLRHGLVDEITFLLYPLALGDGQRFFEPGTNVALDLIETRAMDKGVMLIRYAPKKG
jgi:dihydrofolate reductase